MVDANFGDIFTDFTCSNLICELAKFILYYKQQIPFSYDKLFYAVQKRKHKDQENIKIYCPSERLFRIAEKNVGIFEEIFENTAKTFSSSNFMISEFVFLFGGSILTPKQIYRLHLPIIELGHFPKNHSRALVMSEILGAVVKSEELNKVLSKTLEPTNMFLLLRIHGDVETEKWLVPKPRYKLPSVGQQVNLNLIFEKPENVSCSCKGFQFFSDNASFNSSTSSTLDKNNATPNETSLEYAWYQVPLVFKGFKDVFVSGTSVSKQWLTSTNQCQAHSS